MGEDKNRVFVSYVRDNSDDVNRIREAFLKNGIEYWLDRDQIEPGKIWKQAIREKINGINGVTHLLPDPTRFKH